MPRIDESAGHFNSLLKHNYKHAIIINMNLNLNHSLTGLKTQRQNFGIFSMLLFGFIGAIFITIGVFSFNSIQVDSSWTRITGKVTDIKSSLNDGTITYSPVVEYSVNGQSYKASGSISSSQRPNVGAERQVAYNPNNPADARVVESGGTSLLFLIFPAIGLALLIFGPVLFIKSRMRNRAIKNLIKTGQKIQGVLVDVQSASHSSRNSGYKIIVAATDASGVVQNYISDPLNGIGGLAMADYRTSPIPIDVYIDKAKPSNYYVDIADIPNITPERISQLLGSVTQRPTTITPPHSSPLSTPTASQSGPPIKPQDGPPAPTSQNQQ